MQKYMKKNDIWLLLVILILGVSITFFSSHAAVRSKNSNVIVKVDGQIIHCYSLDDGRYDITTEYGYNIIEICDGKICVMESDCDGRDCIKMGSISKAGGQIVCLPHHLEIYLEGDTDVDTVAY